MNPWFILLLVLVVLGLCAGSEEVGRHVGQNQQQVADQATIDKVNKDIEDNKDEAAKKLVDATKRGNDALRARNTVLQDNADLHSQLASGILRFGTTDVAAGNCSGDGKAAVAASKIVQLPEALARNLRQLARDADDLNADYAACLAGQ